MTRILIAEDNQQNLYLLESILKGNEFTVISAKNGAEALDAAQKNPPDLIITDILMPVMDGFELCRRWKADTGLNVIPFMFYTATYTDPKDEQFALSLGAERFVVKPQKPDVLVRIIRDVLREAQEKTPGTLPLPHGDEKEILRDYNEVLFRKLEKKVNQLETEIERRKRDEEKIRLANRKLALMMDVISQDIQNKVTALRGYIQLGKKTMDEQDRISYIDKESTILESIHNLINDTKDYQQMGIDHSRWIELEKTIRMQFSLLSLKHGAMLACDLQGLEIYSDPLVGRVLYNLLHNAVKHGKTLTRISFTYAKTPEGLVLVCEDDGIGIPHKDKTRIFERVVAGDGSFGLFFVREFLDITGMKIAETGTPGRGARFEITIPEGQYRFTPREL